MGSAKVRLSITSANCTKIVVDFSWSNFSIFSFYPHEESHEGLRATVLQSQTYAKVSENLVSARF